MMLLTFFVVFFIEFVIVNQRNQVGELHFFLVFPEKQVFTVVFKFLYSHNRFFEFLICKCILSAALNQHLDEVIPEKS